jgi:hypothetical protein
MQRKNSVLNRNGMAMVMAIAVIVIISTILALSLRLASQATQKTADLYLYEQSAVLSRAATEYAMLKLSREADPCNLSAINYTYNTIYDINVSMRYVPFNGSTCDINASNIGGNDFRLANTTALESDGTVIMDVTVTANPTGTTEPIRYFRRTIQKL